jgi:NTP pyrophosphatase (non-canonical NTP hydrolase)
MTNTANQQAILLDIVAERARQEQLCRDGKFDRTLATFGGPGDALSPSDCLAVCAEEFGEVAEIVADALNGQPGRDRLDTAHLREELVQLAACCVAWCEQLDARTGAQAPTTAPAAAPESDPAGDLLARRLGIPLCDPNQAPSYIPGACDEGCDHVNPFPFPGTRQNPAWLDLLPDYGGAL